MSVNRLSVFTNKYITRLSSTFIKNVQCDCISSIKTGVCIEYQSKINEMKWQEVICTACKNIISWTSHQIQIHSNPRVYSNMIHSIEDIQCIDATLSKFNISTGNYKFMFQSDQGNRFIQPRRLDFSPFAIGPCSHNITYIKHNIFYSTVTTNGKKCFQSNDLTSRYGSYSYFCKMCNKYFDMINFE
eukprot:197758_1